MTSILCNVKDIQEIGRTWISYFVNSNVAQRLGSSR